jgi:hypothetical protein
MKKVSWADIDEEEQAKEEQNKKYVPPHKKDSLPLPKSETVGKKTKLPHATNSKKL